MTITREFNSIEQALQAAIQDLTDEEIKSATKKDKHSFRKLSDPNQPEKQIQHRDSVDIDIACMKKGRGHPLLNVHQALVDKALHGQNNTTSITQSLLHMGGRIGKLMDVTEKATDPDSPDGSSISKEEKEKIYKALKEVEDKIAALKLSIK